jgi:hypothetical protein
VQYGKNGAQNAIVGVLLGRLRVETFESLNQRIDQSWRMLREISNLRVLQRIPKLLVIRNGEDEAWIFHLRADRQLQRRP